VHYTTIGRPGGQRRDLVVTVVLAGCALDVFRARAGLVSHVEQLGRERDSLAVQAQASSSLQLENRRLRSMLELPVGEFGTYFIAELIPGRPYGGESSRFLLNTSAIEGLDTPLAIATPAGLLGVVRTTTGSTGVGDYWTNPDFRAAVVTEDGIVTGIVRPFVTVDGEQLMLLEGVPFQTNVPTGTPIVTSGLGGIYPRGLSVGTVLAEFEEQLGWTHSYLVEPSVRPGQESVVLGWLPGLVTDSVFVSEPGP